MVGHDGDESMPWYNPLKKNRPKQIVDGNFSRKKPPVAVFFDVLGWCLVLVKLHGGLQPS